MFWQLAPPLVIVSKPNARIRAEANDEIRSTGERRRERGENCRQGEDLNETRANSTQFERGSFVRRVNEAAWLLNVHRTQIDRPVT